MPVFSPGKTLTTSKPLIMVEGEKPGRHIFQLQVVDESGNISKPARVVVEVKAPVINLDATRLTHLTGGTFLNNR